jgi:beta-lactamase regulating signal transducer with metallopeptidase domain
MTLLQVGYAIVVAALLSGAATLAEAGLRGAGRPARWVWVVALALSTTAPLWGPRISSQPESSPVAASAAAAPQEIDALPAASPGAWDWVRAELAQPRAALPWIWWALGLGATAVVGIGLFRLERRTGRLPRGEIGGEEVALSEDFGPALVGLRTPRTVVPRWVLTLARREVGLILAHERAHRAAGDGRLLALGLMAVAACPWNPLVWLQFRRLRDAVEMDCDRRLLRDGVTYPAYARVLVLVRLRAAEVGGGAVALVESSSSLERRLRTMRGFRWTRQRVALTGAAALAMVVAACETPAPSAVEMEAQDPTRAEIESELHADMPFGPDGGAAGILRLRTRSGDEGEAAPGEPLIVVDGVILNQGRLSDVDALDIRRIEVVKGDAAQVRYGERGENGVIQIYTEDFEETEIPFPLDQVRERPDVEGVASKVIHEMKTLAGRATFRLDGQPDDLEPVVEGRRYEAGAFFQAREKPRPGGGN